MENVPSDQTLWQGATLRQETRQNWLSTKCNITSWKFFFFFAVPLSLDVSVLRFGAFREREQIRLLVVFRNCYYEKLKILRTLHHEGVMRGYLLSVIFFLLFHDQGWNRLPSSFLQVGTVMFSVAICKLLQRIWCRCVQNSDKSNV